ncbi:MAG: glycosyltransferase family 8 protein [Clostridia bacterium]|nr:glycosyltransferase family 8 protein [Clostridia bacterium]
MNRNIIPVFFSCDDKYMPFLSVAIRSLIDNASKDYRYEISVLNSGLKEENKQRILSMQDENLTIKFIDVTSKLSRFGKLLHTRDYYTIAIYFRLFIPAMFPKYKKAIYLDSDIVVLDDISKLYFTELDNNLLAGVSDDVIASRPDFIDYAEKGVGIKHEKYFNSGMLLMNLDLMREIDIEERFAELLNTYHFPTVCPDQDYLNVICKDRVLYLDKGWNKMAINNNYEGKPMVVHFNNFAKPWQHDDVHYGEYFWEYANKTEFKDIIREIRENFSDEDMQKQIEGAENLVKSVDEIIHDEKNFCNTLFDGVVG